MIHTEDSRYVIDIDKRKPSNLVLLKMYNFDKRLELIWNEDDNRWEFYRVKGYGVTPDHDVLHWQISAPSLGVDITPGIIDWLKKYNSSICGTLDQEDIRKRWLENFQVSRVKLEHRKRAEMQEVADIAGDIAKRFYDRRVSQIAVPTTVGVNKNNGKPIRAYPKKRRAVDGGRINAV